MTQFAGPFGGSCGTVAGGDGAVSSVERAIRRNRRCSHLRIWIPISGLLAVCTPVLGQTRLASSDWSRIDNTQLAVQLRETASGALTDVLSKYCPGRMTHQPFGEARLLRVTLESPVDQDALADSIDALSNDPDVEFAAPVYISAQGLSCAPLPRLLVRFSPSVTKGAQLELLGQIRGVTIARDPFGGMPNAYMLRCLERAGTAVIEQARQLAALPGVLWAEPDFVSEVHYHHVPDDPFFPQSWHLQNSGSASYGAVGWTCCTAAAVNGVPGIDISATRAWDYQRGDPNTIVVVLDSGVDQSHPDLNQRPGADFTNDPITTGGPFNACDNHGTSVAGCISAIMDNSCGVVGVAPSCLVASARVSSSTVATPCPGTGMHINSSYVDALDWAETIGARVTNASLSFSSSSAISNKYQDTFWNGMIHFASTGNGCSTAIAYPASDPFVTGVGAIQEDGAIACFSNGGTGIYFVAPGVNVPTTDRQGAAGYNVAPSGCTTASGDYTLFGGTSAASPIAAGVAALLLADHPGLSPSDVRTILSWTARDLGPAGYDTTFGWGLVNALRALECAGDYHVRSDAPSGGFGGFDDPFNLVSVGVDYTFPGGHLVIVAGSYDESVTIDHAMRITACAGTVRIGD